MEDNQPLERLTSRVPGSQSVVISKLRFIFFLPLKRMLYFQEICRQQSQSLPYSAEVTKCRLFRYSKDTRALLSDVWPPTVGLRTAVVDAPFFARGFGVTQHTHWEVTYLHFSSRQRSGEGGQPFMYLLQALLPLLISVPAACSSFPEDSFLQNCK